MNLRDFLNSQIATLPAAREPDLPLSRQLAKMYASFATTMKALDSSDPISKRAQEHLGVFESAGRGVCASVDAYLDGFPSQAYEQLRKALDSLRPFLATLRADRNQLENLYRIRDVGTLAQQRREDLFHVPFQLRHLVRSQRYSISGWPCLYLGGSLLVCWEELRRPSFHTLSVAAFSATKNLSVLDLGCRPSVMFELHRPRSGCTLSFFGTEQMVSYLVCWPLVAACSIRVHRHEQSFVEEYIIPQLLLQWLRNEANDIDGLRYFSTRVEQADTAPRLAMDYVFPVKINSQRGFCPNLGKSFALTLPVPWRLLEAIEFRKMSRLISTEELYSLNAETSLRYNDTIFGQLEDKICTMKKARINMADLAV